MPDNQYQLSTQYHCTPAQIESMVVALVTQFGQLPEELKWSCEPHRVPVVAAVLAKEKTNAEARTK